MNQLTLENLLTNADAAEEILKYLQPKYRSNLQKSGRSIYDVVEGASSIYTNNVNFISSQGEVILSYRDDKIQFKFNLYEITDTLLNDVTKFLNAVQNKTNANLVLEVNDYLDVSLKDNKVQLVKEVVDSANNLYIMLLYTSNDKVTHASVFDRDKGSHLKFELTYDAMMNKIQLKLLFSEQTKSTLNGRTFTTTLETPVFKYNMFGESWNLALEELELFSQDLMDQ